MTLQASRGSWIPWVFVAAMGIVVAVNGVMVALAIGSFSGLAHDQAFARGVAYNRVLAALQSQEDLGWDAKLSWEPAGGGAGELRLKLSQADATPLSGASISATVKRPVERGEPLSVELAETALGVYIAKLSLPRPGQWDVELHVTRRADTLDVKQRIFAR